MLATSIQSDRVEDALVRNDAHDAHAWPEGTATDVQAAAGPSWVQKPRNPKCLELLTRATSSRLTRPKQPSELHGSGQFELIVIAQDNLHSRPQLRHGL